MTLIPGDLLNLATAADRAPFGRAPDAAQQVAALILAHLPVEPELVILTRQAALLEAAGAPVVRRYPPGLRPPARSVPP